MQHLQKEIYILEIIGLSYIPTMLSQTCNHCQEIWNGSKLKEYHGIYEAVDFKRIPTNQWLYYGFGGP